MLAALRPVKKRDINADRLTRKLKLDLTIRHEAGPESRSMGQNSSDSFFYASTKLPTWSNFLGNLDHN